MGVAMQAEKTVEQNDIEVWPENWQALDIFLQLETQWRCTSISGLAGARLVWLGLDYAAADVVMRRNGIANDDRDTFSKLRLLEAFALKALDEVI